MIFNFSKKLIEKLKKEGSILDVIEHNNSLNFIERTVYYCVDSKYRRSVRLKEWITKQDNNPLIEAIAAELIDEDEKETVKNVLKYWANSKYYSYGHLKYVGDLENYGSTEYWATIEEILEDGEDDCDGFATVIYLTLRACGIDDYKIHIVAGDVVGGGHAYVTYLGEDLLEYPIDGCYWHTTSLNMVTPYYKRKSYNYGQTEWFRFNISGSYRPRGK